MSQTHEIVVENARKLATVQQEEKTELEDSSASFSGILTQAVFDTVFPKILDAFKIQNKGMELAILNQPIDIIDHEINLRVTGHVQEEIAFKMKSELQVLVKEFTGIHRVGVRIEVNEELDTQKNLRYTSTDKFNFLKEKHGSLVEFQRIFGLDTDY